MGKKPRSAWLDWCVAMAVRTAVAVVQAMPTVAAQAFANLLAQIAFLVDKRHRNVAYDNLIHAFPEKSQAELRRLVRGCYQHFALLVVEIAVLPKKLQVASWRKYASLVNGEAILKHLLGPRPVLIVTAHFGNWELAGFALGLFGFKTYAIARVLDNPYLEDYLKQFRERTGQTIIAKKDDFDRLTTTLQQGGKVATLGDQDAGSRGVFIDFFNRPASAHKAVALMAIEYDAVLLLIGVPRVRSGTNWHYHIQCEEVIDPRDYLQDLNPVKTITQRYHDALARFVRQYPEQYFWLHRRWKTQPKSRTKTV